MIYMRLAGIFCGFLLSGGAIAQGTTIPLHAAADTGATPAPAQPDRGRQMPDVAKSNEAGAEVITNEKFVEEAALGGLTEVEAAHVALERSENPPIRVFAERMITDHGTANAELKVLAQRKKIALPTHLDVAHQAEVSTLKIGAQHSFERAYTLQMREDHDKAVALFEQASRSAALDTQLRQFAERNLTILQHHQQSVHNLPSFDNNVQSANGG